MLLARVGPGCYHRSMTVNDRHADTRYTLLDQARGRYIGPNGDWCMPENALVVVGREEAYALAMYFGGTDVQPVRASRCTPYACFGNLLCSCRNRSTTNVKETHEMVHVVHTPEGFVVAGPMNEVIRSDAEFADATLFNSRAFAENAAAQIPGSKVLDLIRRKFA